MLRGYLRGKLLSSSWLQRIEAVLFILLGILAFGGFHVAYWAQWEKSAWYWSRTVAQEQIRISGTSSPPRWHRSYAYVVGLFWALVGLAVTLPLWLLVGFVLQ